ncbi:hypothetical protein ACQP3F_35020, partial [Escherichia coli]
FPLPIVHPFQSVCILISEVSFLQAAYCWVFIIFHPFIWAVFLDSKNNKCSPFSSKATDR